MSTKIIVALIIGIALIGLIGIASASYFDSYYPSFDSYAHTSIDYTGPTELVDYYGVQNFNIEKPSNLPISKTYSSGYLETSYTCTFNGETISGTLIDDVPPFQIVEDIPLDGATFHVMTSATSIPAHTDIIDYMFPSIFNSYVSTYSFWP